MTVKCEWNLWMTEEHGWNVPCVYSLLELLYHSRITKTLCTCVIAKSFRLYLCGSCLVFRNKEVLFLSLDKSWSASILLPLSVFLLLAVKFGIEVWILLQLWYSRQRGTRSCQLYESLHLQCVYCANSYCNNIKKRQYSAAISPSWGVMGLM